MAKEQKKTKGSKPRYMTTYEAAELLGLSAGTLRVWRCQGKGPSYYKVGNAVRYIKDDYLKRKEVLEYVLYHLLAETDYPTPA